MSGIVKNSHQLTKDEIEIMQQVDGACMLPDPIPRHYKNKLKEGMDMAERLVNVYESQGDLGNADNWRGRLKAWSDRYVKIP